MSQVGIPSVNLNEQLKKIAEIDRTIASGMSNKVIPLKGWIALRDKRQAIVGALKAYSPGKDT